MIWLAIGMWMPQPQSATDFNLLDQQVERLAQAITAEVHCKSLGYSVDFVGVKKTGVEIMDRAVSAGIRMERVQDLVLASVRREEAELDKLAATVVRTRDRGTFDKPMRSRCEGLVNDPVYGQFYKAPSKGQ